MASLLAVQPLDDAGNPIPGWSVWVAVPVAAATGGSFAWWGRRRATRRLPDVQVAVLNQLVAAA